MPELPDILIITPDVSPPADSFTVHKLWDLDDDALQALSPRIRGVSGAVREPVDAAFMERFPALQIIANFGVGYDNVDVIAAARRGIVVTNTPDVLTDEVADLALGLLLATVRRIPQAERYLRADRWSAEGSFSLSPTLRGRRVGIFGLGRIGKAIAQRCRGFDVEICYSGRQRQPAVSYPYYASLVEMAQAVDILIIAAPGGAATRNVVNREVLEALGPQGILINIARGSLVDEEQLVEALRSGAILGAGLDVFAREPHPLPQLLEFENVVLLPHIGSASVQTRRAMAQLAVDNLLAWFREGRPLTPVPETPWPRR